MSHRLHVVISGRVQGVGYRYATHAEAAALHLNGWVRNLDDGRVEAVFEGNLQDLEAVLAWCWQGPPLASVGAVQAEWSQAEPVCRHFTIRG